MNEHFIGQHKRPSRVVTVVIVDNHITKYTSAECANILVINACGRRMFGKKYCEWGEIID